MDPAPAARLGQHHDVATGRHGNASTIAARPSARGSSSSATTLSRCRRKSALLDEPAVVDDEVLMGVGRPEVLGFDVAEDGSDGCHEGVSGPGHRASVRLQPASTSRTWPVIASASRDSRNAADPAMSSWLKEPADERLLPVDELDDLGVVRGPLGHRRAGDARRDRICGSPSGRSRGHRPGERGDRALRRGVGMGREVGRRWAGARDRAHVQDRAALAVRVGSWASIWRRRRPRARNRVLALRLSVASQPSAVAACAGPSP